MRRNPVVEAQTTVASLMPNQILSISDEGVIRALNGAYRIIERPDSEYYDIVFSRFPNALTNEGIAKLSLQDENKLIKFVGVAKKAIPEKGIHGSPDEALDAIQSHIAMRGSGLVDPVHSNMLVHIHRDPELAVRDQYVTDMHSFKLVPVDGEDDQYRIIVRENPSKSLGFDSFYTHPNKDSWFGQAGFVARGILTNFALFSVGTKLEGTYTRKQAEAAMRAYIDAEAIAEAQRSGLTDVFDATILTAADLLRLKNPANRSLIKRLRYSVARGTMYALTAFQLGKIKHEIQQRVNVAATRGSINALLNTAFINFRIKLELLKSGATSAYRTIIGPVIQKFGYDPFSDEHQQQREKVTGKKLGVFVTPDVLAKSVPLSGEALKATGVFRENGALERSIGGTSEPHPLDLLNSAIIRDVSTGEDIDGTGKENPAFAVFEEEHIRFKIMPLKKDGEGENDDAKNMIVYTEIINGYGLSDIPETYRNFFTEGAVSRTVFNLNTGKIITTAIPASQAEASFERDLSLTNTYAHERITEAFNRDKSEYGAARTRVAQLIPAPANMNVEPSPGSSQPGFGTAVSGEPVGDRNATGSAPIVGQGQDRKLEA